MIRFIPESVVLAIHDDQIRLYGGAYGVHDIAALDAALHMPQAGFGGEFLHTTILADGSSLRLPSLPKSPIPRWQ